MKKRFSLLLSMLVMFCGTIIAANYDFHIGGVYFRILLNNKLEPTTNVEVVSGDEKYTGDIVIPSGIKVGETEYTVTRIGQDAFYDCKNVTSVSLPNSVTSKLEVIESRAFGNCEGLTSIRIPDTVTEIEQFAFHQCKNLKSVYMGSRLKTVRYDAFGYCEALERVEISDLAAWCGIAFYYNGTASGQFGPHANPLSYAGHLYLNGKEVVDLVIPKEVTSIHGDLNFYGCVGLKSVTFPDDANVEYIGAWTFSGCENITTLKLNKHLKRIYECAFSGCKVIESLVIPDEVTLIEAAAFSGCTNLKELKLGKAIEEIKTGFWGPAFSGTAIKEITVPEKLQYLSGFQCSQLSTINIGKTSLIEIADGGKYYPLPISRINITDLSTFMNIKKNLGGYDLYLNGNLVEDLIVPSSVEDVIETSMKGCQCLKSVTIPSHVKSIGNNAFQYCTSIETVYFEGGSPTIGKEVFGTYGNVYFITKMLTPSEAPYALINEGQRRNILCVPTGCKEKYETAEGWREFRYIVEASGPDEAFLDNGNLYRINGDEVTMLKGGAHAYYSYSLPETVIYRGKTYPVTVIDCVVHDGFSPDIVVYGKIKSIAEGAFASCTGVHSVTSYIKEPYAINSNVFSDEVKQTITLRVPYGTKAKYQTTDGWKEFANIVEMEDDNPPAGDGEPYVVFNDGTLTFYCDSQRSERSGTTYELNEGSKRPGWYENRSLLNKVVFDRSFANFRPTSMYSWFASATNLTEIEGIQYLNTSSVTKMNSTFYYCQKLTNIDVSRFDTEKVTNMSQMFDGCISLTNLDVSNFNTSSVAYMDFMFEDCKELTNLNVSHFNTEKVVTMRGMFSGCQGLSSLDVSNFNTGAVQNMESLFRSCTKVTKLDVSKFNTSNVTNMAAMFMGCNALGNIDVSGFSTEKVTSMHFMFSHCSSLTELNLNSFDTNALIDKEKDSRVIGYHAIREMVSNCSKLSKVIFGNDFITKEEQNCSDVFKNCTSLNTISFTGNIPTSINSQFFTGVGTADNPATLTVPDEYMANYQAKFDGKMFCSGYFTLGEVSNPDDPISNASAYVFFNDGTLTFYYDDQRSSRQGITYDLNEGEDEPGWHENAHNITKVVFDPSFVTARPTSGHEWFDECFSLTDIEGLEYLNTSEMTFMDEMFFFCGSLKNVDLSHFNTSKVTNMRAMFSGCSGLTSIDLSHFDTSNVERFAAMLNGCRSVTEIDLSCFDTSKAMYFSFLLMGCTSLKEVKFGNSFLISNAAIVDNAFEGCTNLKTVKFTGDIPASINSKFFEGVGTADSPATLAVPELYKANYLAKFDGNMFYGGYFTLSGNGTADLKDGDSFVYKTCEGVDMKFKVISASAKTIQVGTGEENASAIDKDYEGTVTIPDEINGFTVDEIGYNAFVDCKFSNIVFPSTLTTIDGEALLRCMSLKSIFIPRSVKSIAPAAFASCTAVESIVVEEGNEAYDSREGCNAIIISTDNVLLRGCKTTVIPSGIESILFAAFQWTPLEGGLTIPEGVTNIGQAAFYHTTMKSVSLPSTLIYIGGWSFQDCDGLESIGIPDGVAYIGDFAFSFCDNLSVVTIPASVTEIGENAFNGNEKLNVVVSYNTEPRAIADNVFMNNNDFTNATLYVPFGTKAIYEATDGWKNFKNIVELNAKVGDVTGDGNVSKDDIKEVETVILEPSEEFNPNMDVNHDGVVNVADIVITNNIINK